MAQLIRSPLVRTLRVPLCRVRTLSRPARLGHLNRKASAMLNTTRARVTATVVLIIAVFLAFLVGAGIANVQDYLRHAPEPRPYPGLVLQSSEQDIPLWVTRPCRTEDSVNCRWIASQRGNHRGHTFIVRQVPGSTGMVCVFYVNKRYAKHNDYCS